MSLISLHTLTHSNSQGLIEVEYIPTYLLNAASWELLSSVGTYTGSSFNAIEWLKAPLAIKGKVLDESAQPSAQGIVYTYNVSGSLLRDTADISDEIRKMLQYRYILRLTDAEGRKRIVGDLDNPFQFSSNMQKSDSQNGYTINWTLSSPNKMLFI